MPPAAREGDATAHGTPLAGGGSPDVIVGGKPAWRAVSDFHSCPLASGPSPHGGGVVTTGSTTVLINGLPAARQGDVIVENGPPNTIVTGASTVMIGGGSTSAEPPWATSLYDRLSGYVGDYNEAVTGSDPGFVGERLTDETVNLQVTAEAGEAAFSFRTDGANRIVEFERGTREDATVRMETDRETVERITDADRPARAYRRAVANGGVAIRGIGPINRLKWRLLGGIRGLVDGG